MCNMAFIQFYSRKDNTEKKLSKSSNFTCINICMLCDNCCAVCNNNNTLQDKKHGHLKNVFFFLIYLTIKVRHISSNFLISFTQVDCF
jgi:hypothetical protein